MEGEKSKNITGKQKKTYRVHTIDSSNEDEKQLQS